MALKNYDKLTEAEVQYGELLSTRIALSVIVHSILADNPNSDAVYAELERAAAQVSADIPIQRITEPERKQAFQELLIDRSGAVFRQARGIRREVHKTN